jgi:hypothetical protein
LGYTRILGEIRTKLTSRKVPRALSFKFLTALYLPTAEPASSAPAK